jgi:hypothetical protein
MPLAARGVLVEGEDEAGALAHAETNSATPKISTRQAPAGLGVSPFGGLPRRVRPIDAKVAPWSAAT